MAITNSAPGGNVQVNNSGAITLAAAATITASGSGTVTLGVGTGNAAGSSSTIAGTINSGGQVAVNGGPGNDVLDVPLTTVGLNKYGLIFHGGAGTNVLDIGSKAGSNVYCIEESTSTIFHGTAQSPVGYDAELSYDANVQKVEIDGNGGTDNVTVHVSNAYTPTQFWLNASANKGSTLKIDASATNLAQKYAIGNFPAGWQVGTLAPDLVTSTLAWVAALPTRFRHYGRERRPSRPRSRKNSPSIMCRCCSTLAERGTTA